MPGMRRADRRNSNDDNALNNPRARTEESTSPRELKQLLMTARSQRDEAQTARDQARQLQQETATQLVHIQKEFQTSQFKIQEWEERATQNHQLFLGEQQKYQQTLCLYNQEQAKATELFAKFGEAETQRVKYLTLYNEEQARATELFVKFEEAETQRVKYLTLCNEAQEQLKFERRSKAGIKVWETRRKLENDRLKQEIAEMVILLRESLASKDEAVSSLYTVAERMDRIQQLVDSVEEDSTNTPGGLLQKLRRIWLAIKDILAE
jgi:hypothetical protein